MKYLNRKIGGFETRNKFVRSMDVANAPNAEKAWENYYNAWFSSRRKHYIRKAFDMVSEKSLFWPAHAITDMIDEIVMTLTDPEADFGYDEKKLLKDADILKSRLHAWMSHTRKKSVTRDDVLKAVRSFEAKYRYPCPDTFKTCWTNTGSYIALVHDVKYDGLKLPGCADTEESLDLLNKLALEVLADMDHDVDKRLFGICYALYKARYDAERLKAEMQI